MTCVRIQYLEPDLTPVSYATPGSSGFDLRARQAATLAPGQRALVPTGIVLELPEGFEAQIRPCSGLALKHGITVLNSPGTIDRDFRGELQIILINLGQEIFEVQREMRIAQCVVATACQVQLQRVEELSKTQRGAGAFGSTGVF